MPIEYSLEIVIGSKTRRQHVKLSRK